MEDREQKSRGAGCFLIGVIALILFPVLYVLALGPASVIADRFPGTRGFMQLLYLPAGLLAKHCEPIERALRWYFDLWI